MYKSLLVILCLLVGAMPIGAQKRAPQPRVPSPDVQRIFDTIRAMTPEQRARLREIALTVLDERRARAQGVGPIAADQYPVPSGLTPSLDFSPIFCFFNCKPSAVVPPKPIFSESPIKGDFSGIDLKGFNGITLWDSGEFDRLMAKPINLDLSLDLNLEGVEAALNQLPQLVPASNQPPVPRSAGNNLTRSLSASAASSRTRSRVFRDIPNSKVKKLPCYEQCYVFYARCNAGPENGGTGPKGGRKNPNACEEGLRACKAYGCN